MKVLYLYIILQLTILFTQAETGKQPADNSTYTIQAVENTKSTAGATKVKFQNQNFHQTGIDSFLVIYDKYDRSGAGIVNKVFYPAVDHTISIDGIPPGKYFITIQRLGAHREKFEKVIRIKSRKCESVDIKLETRDEFVKERVMIPAETIDFAKLKVTEMK